MSIRAGSVLIGSAPGLVASRRTHRAEIRLSPTELLGAHNALDELILAQRSSMREHPLAFLLEPITQLHVREPDVDEREGRVYRVVQRGAHGFVTGRA